MYRYLIIALFVCSVIASAQSRSTPLVIVGSDTITVAEFADVYLTHLAADTATDTYSSRLLTLQSLADQSIFYQFGWDQGLHENHEIVNSGYRTWRNTLLNYLGSYKFADEVERTTEQIEIKYRQQNSVYKVQYFFVPDSLTGEDNLRLLKTGARFEQLALSSFFTNDFLSGTIELKWKYPQQLPESIAEVLYSMSVGDYSPPVYTPDGFAIVHLLDKQFRPDHGHFERIKRLQTIAAEHENVYDVDAVSDILRERVAGYKIKWRKSAIRKIFKLGILATPQPLTATDPAVTKLLDANLFRIGKVNYTLEWILERLDLLEADDRYGIVDLETFQTRVKLLLEMDHAMSLLSDATTNETGLGRAEENRWNTIRQAVMDSVKQSIIATADPSDAELRDHLAVHRGRYIQAAQFQVDEIVVRDSVLAAQIIESLNTGTSFSDLATRHTLRQWVRESGGNLGWVPTSSYRLNNDFITAAKEKHIIGPFAIDGYYVILNQRGYRPESMPPFKTLRARLKKDWIVSHRTELIDTWLLAQYGNGYHVRINHDLLDVLEFPGY